MNTLNKLFYIATATITLMACGNNQEPAEETSNLIEISAIQFATDSMLLGEPETKSFENVVKCVGTVVTLPNGTAKLNAPVNGIIRRIDCYNGQLVTGNQLLIEITGNEIIDLQKEFAEASATHQRIKKEYERVKALYTEKVTSEKEFILTETEFKISLAKYHGLRLKIEAIGYSASRIESGEFYPSYSIKSPIDGIISNLQVSIGSYVDAQTELAEIINPDMFQVKFSVFADDISQMKTGQPVRFKSIKNSNMQEATISSMGVVVDNETKTIDCYATIKRKIQTNLVVNEFVETEVITGIDTVNAIPSDALIKTESGYAVLVLKKQENEKYYFLKTDVKIGREQGLFSEIVEPEITGTLITKGAYNITPD